MLAPSGLLEPDAMRVARPVLRGPLTREGQRATRLPIGIDDALAEARGLHTSFVLAHQYLGQLSPGMAEAIDANARNKVYFALAPRDAIDQARHLRPYLDDGDLIRLGGYEVVLRPVAGGRIVPPVTADTEPPPPPIDGRASELRQATREHTGLPLAERRRLLGETATGVDADDEAQPGDELTQPPIEPHNFQPKAVDPERSPVTPQVTSHEAAREGPRGDEHAGEHAPLHGTSAHVNGDEEDWWTGTD